MRVLLVSANTERIKMTSLPLGLGMVAKAVRQAGHETAFLDLRFYIRPGLETFIREAIARRHLPIPDR